MKQVAYLTGLGIVDWEKWRALADKPSAKGANCSLGSVIGSEFIQNVADVGFNRSHGNK